MNELRILGLYITDRTKEASQVQSVLTRYGCSIKTRLGLHEVVDNYCSTSGLILLELTGEDAELDRLEKDLHAIQGLDIQKMSFKK